MGGRDRESEPRGWADNQGELSVEQLTLVQRPVPSVLKQARAVGQEGANPVMQGGAGCGGAVGRGGWGTPGQEEASAENEAGLRSGGTDN